jgi:glycosyltransferase involved in cell wall biosynthesis
VPEIVEENVTGYIVEDELSAVNAVSRIGQIDRRRVRKRFEERFTARRMALDYMAAYREVMQIDRPRLKVVAGLEN